MNLSLTSLVVVGGGLSPTEQQSAAMLRLNVSQVLMLIPTSQDGA
jgi:hypothetical protein